MRFREERSRCGTVCRGKSHRKLGVRFFSRMYPASEVRPDPVGVPLPLERPLGQGEPAPARGAGLHAGGAEHLRGAHDAHGARRAGLPVRLPLRVCSL